MTPLGQHAKVYMVLGATDMRKAIDGLSLVVAVKRHQELTLSRHQELTLSRHEQLTHPPLGLRPKRLRGDTFGAGDVVAVGSRIGWVGAAVASGSPHACRAASAVTTQPSANAVSFLSGYDDSLSCNHALLSLLLALTCRLRFHGLGWLLQKHTRTSFFLEPIAFAPDSQDMAVMKQAIKNSRRGYPVAKYNIPFTDRTITRNTETSALVTS